MPTPPRKLDYIPEILYETPSYPGEKPSPIPYMEIPKDKDMPIGLFLLEYRSTGEFEMGTKNKPEPIMEGPFPHMYIEFNYLTEVLREVYPSLDIDKAVDQIRNALGMKSRAASKTAGEAILNNVEAKTERLTEEIKRTQPTRVMEYKKATKTS